MEKSLSPAEVAADIRRLYLTIVEKHGHQKLALVSARNHDDAVKNMADIPDLYIHIDQLQKENPALVVQRTKRRDTTTSTIDLGYSFVGVSGALMMDFKE